MRRMLCILRRVQAPAFSHFHHACKRQYQTTDWAERLNRTCCDYGWRNLRADPLWRQELPWANFGRKFWSHSASGVPLFRPSPRLGWGTPRVRILMIAALTRLMMHAISLLRFERTNTRRRAGSFL